VILLNSKIVVRGAAKYFKGRSGDGNKWKEMRCYVRCSSID
ncbi:hypothetical protein THOM_1065, partial [Trachipleistophora hominis]